MTSVESSDEAFTEWMRGNLDRAARAFGLTLAGEPGFGWRLRSLSAPARDRDGRDVWLRVLTERTHWVDEFWTGNVDANNISGVPKPRVLDWREWDVPDQRRRVRAEVLTLLPGRVCSPTDVLHAPLELPDAWWSDLRRALDTIRSVPTTRFANQPVVSKRAHEVFGVEIRVERRETVHGDLHWANLLAPELGVLDWEMWGRGPVGADVANLYCMSLLVPDVARRVHAEFADVLDSPDGQIAQIVTAARLLHRANLGDFPELKAPLRRHVAPLLMAAR